MVALAEQFIVFLFGRLSSVRFMPNSIPINYTDPIIFLFIKTNITINFKIIAISSFIQIIRIKNHL